MFIKGIPSRSIVHSRPPEALSGFWILGAGRQSWFIHGKTETDADDILTPQNIVMCNGGVSGPFFPKIQALPKLYLCQHLDWHICMYAWWVIYILDAANLSWSNGRGDSWSRIGGDLWLEKSKREKLVDHLSKRGGDLNWLTIYLSICKWPMWWRRLLKQNYIDSITSPLYKEWFGYAGTP